MQSIWNLSADIPDFPPLTENKTCDVCVIGAGMAGILTAWRLQNEGLSVIVIDADRPCGGQTGRTTAKLTVQHGMIYKKLVDSFGDAGARQYADWNSRGLKEYRRLVKERGINCDFTDCASVLYSVKESEPLMEELSAMKQAGLFPTFTHKTELPFQISGAVMLSDQARFDPLRFLADFLPELTIYGHTPITTVKKHTVMADRACITAGKIVFACHFPFPTHPGYYFMRMHEERSYVLALKNAPKLNDVYLGVDENANWSLREANGYLLFGGAGHRTGENRKGGSYIVLRAAAKRFFPDSVEAAHWSAQDCMPIDGVPYIGCFSPDTPDWFIATGFQKWGMTTSMAASMILTELISGREVKADVFAPSRFTPVASAKNLMNETGHAVKNLSRRIFTPPRGLVEDLPKGHGGVVEYEGQKLGVYRDEAGQTFAVSIKCPHLGCQLEWNPDEKSWDCPCHGSRFDYQGRLLDGPAQEDLFYESLS